jgi:hypothetical protein
LNPRWTMIPDVRLEAYKARTAWKAQTKELTAHKRFIKNSCMPHS